MDSFRKILTEEFDSENIVYTEKNVDDICVLYKLLSEYNEKVNLTAITGEKEAAKKHFADSLLPIRRGIFRKGSKCLDIGTGAGFPGLPLSIFLPDCSFLLIDSLSKKLAFTELAIKKIGLKNVETKVARAEDFIRSEPQSRESFDIVFSRAVANLTTLSELTLPFVKIGGYFVAFKSREAKKELKDAEFAIETLGGEPEEIFGGEERNLIIIKKVSQTPKKYPRRSGIPEKRPLKKY